MGYYDVILINGKTFRKTDTNYNKCLWSLFMIYSQSSNFKLVLKISTGVLPIQI